MGYQTTFQIEIVAATEARRLEIVRNILQLAKVTIDTEKEAIKEYQSGATKGFYSLIFTTAWYGWELDLSGNWYNYEVKGLVRRLILNEKESLSVLGYGEMNGDIWKAFVSKRRFSRQHCFSYRWINKKSQCDNNAINELLCTGCQNCADRDPVFD